jgi:hypothetical protein
MIRQTLVITAAGGGTFTVDTVNVSGSRIGRQHGTAVVSGTQVDFTPSCPAPSDGGSSETIMGYTATATTSTLTTFTTTTSGILVVDVYMMR